PDDGEAARDVAWGVSGAGGLGERRAGRDQRGNAVHRSPRGLASERRAFFTSERGHPLASRGDRGPPPPRRCQTPSIAFDSSLAYRQFALVNGTARGGREAPALLSRPNRSPRRARNTRTLTSRTTELRVSETRGVVRVAWRYAASARLCWFGHKK